MIIIVSIFIFFINIVISANITLSFCLKIVFSLELIFPFLSLYYPQTLLFDYETFSLATV